MYLKSILMSIRPSWCELIANGMKTIEVRKTKPKLEPPFKVYIYCTKGKYLWKYKNKVFLDGKYNRVIDNIPNYLCNGKVIGEFVCDYILTCMTEFYTENEYIVYEALYEWNADQEVWTPLASNDDESPSKFLNDTAMNFEEFRSYLGNGEKTFYAWHISDLKIYDKPKELNEFATVCKGLKPYKCDKCEYSYTESNGSIGTYYECCCNGLKPITRPPQSWCYVEEI